MYLFVNSAVFLTTLCLAYTSLVFALKFDGETCKDWLSLQRVSLLFWWSSCSSSR